MTYAAMQLVRRKGTSDFSSKTGNERMCKSFHLSRYAEKRHKGVSL